MEIMHGEVTTKYGPGVSITLSGNEIATAISAYLVAHDVHVVGPRTIRVNGELCGSGSIYVDPSGRVVAKGKAISGRGKVKAAPEKLDQYKDALNEIANGLSSLSREAMEQVAREALFGE